MPPSGIGFFWGRGEVVEGGGVGSELLGKWGEFWFGFGDEGGVDVPKFLEKKAETPAIDGDVTAVDG